MNDTKQKLKKYHELYLETRDRMIKREGIKGCPCTGLVNFDMRLFAPDTKHGFNDRKVSNKLWTRMEKAIELCADCLLTQAALNSFN